MLRTPFSSIAALLGSGRRAADPLESKSDERSRERDCTPPMQQQQSSGRSRSKEGCTPATGRSSGKRRSSKSSLGRRSEERRRPYPPSPTKRGRTSVRRRKDEIVVDTTDEEVEDYNCEHFHSIDSSPWRFDGRFSDENCSHSINTEAFDSLYNKSLESDKPINHIGPSKFNLSPMEERQVLHDYAHVHGSMEVHLRPLPTLFAQPSGRMSHPILHPELDGRMRCKLISWLAEVCQHFHLAPPTWYLTVYYLDRYLSVGSGSSRPGGVQKNRFQLVGTACLYVAAKVEEIYPPNLKEICQIFGGNGEEDEEEEEESFGEETSSYSYCRPSDLADAELQVLLGLRWHLNVATPYHWVACYLSILESNIRIDPKSFNQQSLRIPDIFDAVMKMISRILHLPQSLWFSYSQIAAAGLLLCLQNGTYYF